MNLAVQVRWWWRAFQQLVVQSLVVSLAMLVLDVLVNYQPKVPFTQQDNPVETFLLDGKHEPFRHCQLGIRRTRLDRIRGRFLDPSGARHFRPSKEGTGSPYPVVGWPNQMPSYPEEIQNDALDRQEPLRLSGGFEPAHLSLSLSRRLMRDFGPIVGVTFRDVNDRGHDRPVCRAIASQLVGDQPSRLASLAFQ